MLVEILVDEEGDHAPSPFSRARLSSSSLSIGLRRSCSIGSHKASAPSWHRRRYWSIGAGFISYREMTA